MKTQVFVLGKTVPDLAEAAGVHRSTIYKILNGETEPRVKTIDRLVTCSGLCAGGRLTYCTRAEVLAELRRVRNNLRRRAT